MQHGTFSVPGTEARNSDTDGHGTTLGRSPRQDAAEPKNTTGQPPRLPRRVKMNLVYLITCVILVSSLECNAFIAFSGFQFH